MLLIISPAKTLDPDVRDLSNSTQPEFLQKAVKIISELKKFKPDELSKLMDISPKLAAMNADRYAQWSPDLHQKQGKASVLVYKGEVYQGLQADDFSLTDFLFAQQHLRILSGLYGVLRPLDLILPYRLEMGTILSIGRSGNLYEYWKSSITNQIVRDIKSSGSDILVNLASEEYFKAIDTGNLKTRIITPVFKDFKNGQYKFISFFAKKARGLMSRFIIKEKILNPLDIKLFNYDGYYFNERMSAENMWTFSRG